MISAIPARQVKAVLSKLSAWPAAVGTLLALVTITPSVAEDVPALYQDRSIFEKAIAAAVPGRQSTGDVTGLIVPHHLLAADMIASALERIGRDRYRRIVLISPDSHRAATRPFHVSRARFETVFGFTTPDVPGAEHLAMTDTDGTLFEREHGLHAILPFIVRRFPDTPILPIILASRIEHGDLLALEEELQNLGGPNTLFVLSSDFSHFLPVERAIARDQETLNILATGDPDAVRALRQPEHLDNRDGLWLILRVQQALGASLEVIDNRNAQFYSTRRAPETTSYITGVFRTPHADVPGEADLCLAGDLFLGRGFLPYVATRDRLAALARLVREEMPRCPLIVNLEGVVTEQPVVGAPPRVLWALRPSSVAFLREIRVVGMTVANNHAMDLGPDAYREMVQALRREGFVVFEHGVPQWSFGATILALTEGTRANGKAVAGDLSLAALREGDLRPPIIALPHWGTEWETEPGPEQLALAYRLRDLGASGVFGAHPHVAAPDLTADPDGRQIGLYSMGNFLFDQLSPPASGKIVLLDIFDQGTFFTRIAHVDGFFSKLEGR